MRSISTTFLVLLASVGVSCTGPRSAAPAASASPTAGAQAANTSPKSRLVCHTERPTGSNIAQRVCYTEEQRDESSRATQEELRRMSQQSSPQQQRN